MRRTTALTRFFTLAGSSIVRPEEKESRCAFSTPPPGEKQRGGNEPHRARGDNAIPLYAGLSLVMIPVSTRRVHAPLRVKMRVEGTSLARVHCRSFVHAGRGGRCRRRRRRKKKKKKRDAERRENQEGEKKRVNGEARNQSETENEEGGRGDDKGRGRKGKQRAIERDGTENGGMRLW